MSVVSEHSVYLDTNAIIGIVELGERLTAGQKAFVGKMAAGAVEAVTSEVALAECLVKPIADRNAADVAAFMSFLSGEAQVAVEPVTRHVLLAAAEIRAETGMRLADAIHMATAKLAGAKRFVTNDRRIKPAEGVTIAIWDQV